MILRSIMLENIRSYREATSIDLLPGTTLFEGDVASGKSTILSAVEFALFGLGDLNGSFLLRNGSAEGRVVLAFEVDGKEYRVHRSLVKKGENVRSGDSYFESDGEKEKLATKELKDRVLQLLKFNEPPNPKSQSVIYRYAIFTPQEAMRDIIERDPGTRLETLRKAYGIEQYRTAAQNTKSASNEFRMRIAGIKGRIGNLENDRTELTELLSSIGNLRTRLAEAKKKEEILRRDLDDKRVAREEFEAKKTEIGKAQERIPLLSKSLREKEELRKAALKESELAGRRIVQLERDIARLEPVRTPSAKGVKELENELQGLTRSIADGRDQISKLSERLENFEEILEKGVCPICEREYAADRVSERKQHLEGELSVMSERVSGREKEKEAVERAIEGLEQFLEAQRDLKPLKESLSDWKQRAAEGSTRAAKLEVEITELNEQFRKANKESEPLQKILTEIVKLDDAIAQTEKKHASEMRTIGGIEKEIETSSAEAERRARDINEKEGLLKKQVQLEEDRVWLLDYFAPTIELIESQTFANRNQRFNSQFQKWFQILVDDPDLRVRVKEDFSPVIEREGYEQDYGQLSGGERTSVALAYRLALNTTVQETALGQEPNLLILDEPTDGFSKEQLAKFGDILTELRCPQVILVSHEKELENLADTVYRIEKTNGVSTVSAVPPYQK
ncbi:MAG: SMC family ATPase [Nitrososphaerota archaeon]|jgi:exonuclease SbcC|nr:SMC family ATPase [Nitrososphaerota archaeon]